ncbi:MAG: Uncharacterised protein [Owenweeksia sp. TMED14]|nr:MAG: Uncharacterised protein [Owenweeksia sp. TMED14]
MSATPINYIERGDLLLSHPLISDLDFKNTVVLLVNKDKVAVTGFILNNKSNFTLKDAFGEEWPDLPLLIGGPVEQESLFYIHRSSNLIPKSEHICGDLYWGGDFRKMREALFNNKLKEQDILFFIGYSGWSLDQIMDEIKEESWALVKNYNLRNLEYKNNFYNELRGHLPETFKIWSNTPKEINWN